MLSIFYCLRIAVGYATKIFVYVEQFDFLCVENVLNLDVSVFLYTFAVGFLISSVIHTASIYQLHPS